MNPSGVVFHLTSMACSSYKYYRNREEGNFVLDLVYTNSLHVEQTRLNLYVQIIPRIGFKY